MKASICLLCLKQLDEEILSTSEEISGVPLLTKFLKFANNYLQVTRLPSSEQLLRMAGSGGNDGFCEKCELSVINPICTVYAQLLATQLRLFWEVEQLEKVLKHSTSSVNVDLLTDKFGVSQLKQFRRSLQENCQLKTKEMLPQVLVERLKIITATVELTQSQDDPNVKVETGSIFENDDDCDDDDVFDPLDIDTSHSLHSDGHPDEHHRFVNLTHNIDRIKGDDEIGIDVEHNTLKMEILEPTRLLGKSDDADEVIDQTYSPDDLKKTVKRTQVGDKAPFHCPKCPKIFSTHRQLWRHGYNVHHDRRYMCPQCKSYFKSATHLAEHVTSIHKPEPQTCQHCGTVCKSLKAFKMHMSRKHADQIQPKCQKPDVLPDDHDDVKKKQFSCPKCSKIFPTREKMKVHVHQVHTNRRYRCLHCKSCFKSKGNLRQHVASIHKPRPQTCQHCGMVCKSRKAFEMHMVWKHTDPIIQPKCPKCGRNFKRKESIKKHLPICSGGKFSAIKPPKGKTGVN